jgi:D-3-phosphoglycerate dehydrogenase / 2-oxoglutarate reductase
VNASPGDPVILVTGADLAPEAQAILAGFRLVYAGRTPGEDDLVRLCAQHQPVAIIVRYGKITPRVVDACANLRVISKHGSGIDTIDAAAAAARRVAVRAAAGANAAAVAEHTWALILACAKAVPYLNERMHQGHWDKATHKSIELTGRTLGLIGIGAIGARVAAVGIAMGMEVLAYDPYAKERPPGIALCELQDLLRRSDILSLHCPLTDENRNLVDRKALTLVRNGAILVNTARGGLIDEDALVEALQSGRLSAVGLDTFSEEPPGEDLPLRNLPSVIMTPHIGGVTGDAYRNMGVAAAKNILAELETKEKTQ